MINEKFYELEKEKQDKIINAAIEVFSKNDYKNAVTEEIAYKAEISKGLLFYYFKNKKTLYLFLIDNIIKIIEKRIEENKITQIKDFFDLMNYAAKIKLDLVKENPHILDFCIRSYYCSDKNIISEIKKLIVEQCNESYEKYFYNIDLSKFKDKNDLFMIYKIFIWIMDGYLHEKLMRDEEIKSSDIILEFDEIMELLKKYFYK
ncbi:TetR/AcrR family transcriptional regulator [Anaerofustis butyriciformans]|uniref:TetR/AcrR family transcriptional regulator n=1 Tax=Anaerofustis butyriciformans TaxID=3108533 RepID=UPI002E2F3CFF|nr:TetR/AcrR family transcriptional regulator [Anaerofustis sp. HA2171]